LRDLEDGFLNPGLSEQSILHFLTGLAYSSSSLARPPSDLFLPFVPDELNPFNLAAQGLGLAPGGPGAPGGGSAATPETTEASDESKAPASPPGDLRSVIMDALSAGNKDAQQRQLINFEKLNVANAKKYQQLLLQRMGRQR
jgi:hypothetical protein